MTDELTSVVYASTASQPFRSTALDELLAACRRANANRDVTGMLLYRGGRFIQVLEGSRSVLTDLVESIRRDTRHHDLRVLIEEPIHHRRFADWTMGYHTFRTHDGALPDGYRDSFADLETDADADPGARRARAHRALAELTLWFRVRSGVTATANA